MQRWLLYIMVSSLFALKSLAGEACSTSYLKNENWVPHSMSRQELVSALVIAKRDGVDRGWRYVSGFGDNYAGLASLVTRKNADGTLSWFSKMVHRHWQTVVGPELEKRFFEKVALRHFSQYVEILTTGTWPDSNQILLSYLTAVRSFGLPDELVFDAVWQSSRYRFLLDWRAFNILPLERWADTGRVCLHIDEDKANCIIETDFQ